MKLFLSKNKESDARYCLVTNHGSPFSYPLAHGVEVAPRLVAEGVEGVTLNLNESIGGLDLPDLVANDRNFLVLRKSCAESILSEHELGPHEVVPAILMNEKGRVHADDYVFLNPHGKFDCLDMERSDMDGLDESSVKMFGKFWIRASSVPAHDIFRVKGLPIGYVYSERLVDFIRQRGFTNFVFSDIQIS